MFIRAIIVSLYCGTLYWCGQSRQDEREEGKADAGKADPGSRKKGSERGTYLGRL
jgi:hypothetical protein